MEGVAQEGKWGHGDLSVKVGKDTHTHPNPFQQGTLLEAASHFGSLMVLTQDIFLLIMSP